jgi:hypothetical protein
MSRRGQYPRAAVKVAVWLTGLVTVSACAAVVSACSSAHGTYSGATMRHTVVSRPISGVRVGLAPILEGGSAGWCIARTSTDSSGKGSGASCVGSRTSTGPIIVEACNGNKSTDVVVLTRGEVATVAVAGGTPILTESNSTLPAGLRAAVIELPGYRIVPKSFTVGYPWLPCPRVTPFDANAKPIDKHGTSRSPLAVSLPRRRWEAPARPPSGVCQITSTRLPRETVAAEGMVTIRVRPFSELLGRAFISCAETTYIYKNEHHLPAAVLLDAARPGAPPPGLPGMKPLAGHPSIFEAPPDRFARRIRRAWLVVQEEDNIGPSVPVDLLEDLRATVRP